MSEVVLKTYLVEFKGGRSVYLACEDLQEVLERCEDEYPKKVIDTVYKEVYCNYDDGEE
jgi:hypothetical protein